MPDRQHLISAFCNSRYKKAILFLLYGVMLCAFASGAPLYAASVYTDRPDYPPGDSVAITANGFWNNENVTVQVTHLDGTPTDGEGHDPWQVIANALGNFETFWNIPYDDNLLETLLVTAIGQSSGLLAMTTFADCNSNLYFTANIPDTLCPGQSYNACARLVEVCKKGNYAPLPNRPIIFYLNPGNCGVNQGQNGFDTIWTDANGIACVTVPVPSTPGEYSLRAKYLGESKPAYGQPGNSACQPGTRLEISASNVCERFIVNSASCNRPPVATCPGNTSVFLCGLGPVCTSGFSYSDPDGDPVSVTVSLGTLTGNTVCFTPSGEGNYTIRLIATDSHGLADTCETVVTVNLNDSPVANCPGNLSKFVCDLSPITIPGFTWSDPNNNIKTITAVGGTLSGNSIVFTPVVGANTLKLIVTDSCNVADTCQTVVTVALNAPPDAVCPGNQSKFVCDLSPITIPGFSWSDPNNNVKTITAVGGSLSGNSIVFTPVVGANTLKLIVTDSCNVADTCQTVVTVTLNSKPVASCPGNQSKFVCDLSPITIPGFTWSDPNNNLKTITAVGGTLSGNSIVFTPVVGANTLKLIVTDSCNVADTCQTVVTVALNAAPDAACPGNQSKFV
ncbi:MAG: hypothetical protein NT002_01365, partial [candidate division Zixibacteria bacterium]|nr:hypothetical protein [candidate division Zixibacteria bacterium]